MSPRPLRPMTLKQIEAAANAARDNRPLSAADFGRMRRTPQVKIIRRALGISQEDFAARYQIPIGTLRDWEQGRVAPDQAARAYLTVIARDPEAVAGRLMHRPDRSRDGASSRSKETAMAKKTRGSRSARKLSTLNDFLARKASPTSSRR